MEVRCVVRWLLQIGFWEHSRRMEVDAAIQARQRQLHAQPSPRRFSAPAASTAAATAAAASSGSGSATATATATTLPIPPQPFGGDEVWSRASETANVESFLQEMYAEVPFCLKLQAILEWHTAPVTAVLVTQYVLACVPAGGWV